MPLVEGTKEVIVNLGKVKAKGIREVIEKSSISSKIIADKAREITPVRTGELKRSIHAYNPVFKFGDVVTEIKAEKYYAIFVELGTSKMRARPYLSQGAKNSVDKIKEVFTKLNLEY